jgi:hypothetical protein
MSCPEAAARSSDALRVPESPSTDVGERVGQTAETKTTSGFPGVAAFELAVGCVAWRAGSDASRTRYLVDLHAPPRGTVCAADQTPFHQ